MNAHAAVCQVQLETERKWRQIQVLPSLRRWIDLRPAVKRRYGRSAVTLGLRLYCMFAFEFTALFSSTSMLSAEDGYHCSAHGLRQSVEKAGLQWQGSEHSGIDDARWV